MGLPDLFLQWVYLNVYDCIKTGLRLLGIGRNQYIDLMNQSRSTRKLMGFFRGSKSVSELLPGRPVESMPISPWWSVQV